MRALVVFESMFGNTQEVARAVADGLSTRLDVELAEVGGAVWRPGTELLVVGGPTHAFGMSRPGTRADAAKQRGGPVVSGETGIREWLESLPPVPDGSARPAAATFDTRVSHPRMPGSAARAMHKRLRRSGFDLVAPSESFWVEGTPGPLVPDETTRARSWGVSLAEEVAGRSGQGAGRTA
ncbi:flavodoxin/nitric oxide synthase [Sanguibacter sp. 25GB23B1]|uniref:flavodoxin family protein n=1 Tax=unclassified Sanguibacter TaxID=2645534 RepID=UPI0032AFEC0C